MRRKSPFIDSIQRTMRLRGYSIRTEQSYLYWIRYYIRFHKYNRQVLRTGTQKNLGLNGTTVGQTRLSFLVNNYLTDSLILARISPITCR